MKVKRVTETDVDNLITESFLYKRFRLLALNTFQYEGLDDLDIEERHIEKYLCDEGKCIWFMDNDLGLMCLPCEGLGVNVHGDPTRYRARGFGYTKELSLDECVLMENNKLRMPTQDVLLYFTRQLYEVVRTRDVNVKTLKLPFIVATDDKQQLTAKKILEQIDENTYAIVTNKNVVNIEELIKVLPTGVKPYTTELTDLYHDILNECLTYLGINNANTDKKERLITNEVNANNQFISSCAEMFLESRKRAVERINTMFGTNISVKLRNSDLGGKKDVERVIQGTTTDQQQSNHAGA